MTFARIRRLLPCALLLWTTPCWATPISLDQFFIPTQVPPNGVLAEDTETVAQTFTVGLGGLLTAIDLELACCLRPTGEVTFPSDDLLIEIRTTLPDGSPSNDVLATMTARSRQLSVGSFEFERFRLGADRFYVSPGDVLAIVLSSTAPALGLFNPYAWSRDVGYDGGAAFFDRGDGFLFLGSDMGFKTYVRPVREPANTADVRSVPEPASFSLIALGIAAIARVRIYKHRRGANVDERKRVTHEVACG